MHEFSIMEKLFNIILEQAEQNQLINVKKIHLKIGKLRQIMPDFLEFAFEQVAKDTIAANAKLTIEMIDGKDIILESIEGDKP